MSAGDYVMCWGMKFGGGDFYYLLVGAERKERLQQVVCYRTRNKTQGLDLEERTGRKKSATSLKASLDGSLCVLKT